MLGRVREQQYSPSVRRLRHRRRLLDEIERGLTLLFREDSDAVDVRLPIVLVSQILHHLQSIGLISLFSLDHWYRQCELPYPIYLLEWFIVDRRLRQNKG